MRRDGSTYIVIFTVLVAIVLIAFSLQSRVLKLLFRSVITTDTESESIFVLTTLKHEWPGSRIAYSLARCLAGDLLREALLIQFQGVLWILTIQTCLSFCIDLRDAADLTILLIRDAARVLVLRVALEDDRE